MDYIKVVYEGVEALGCLGKAAAAQERRGKLLAGGGKTTGHKGGQGRLETIKLMLGRVEKGEEGRRRLRGLYRGGETGRKRWCGRVRAGNNTMPHRKRRYNQVESEIRLGGTCGP